jgi:hypothetical protein
MHPDVNDKAYWKPSLLAGIMGGHRRVKIKWAWELLVMTDNSHLLSEKYSTSLQIAYHLKNSQMLSNILNAKFYWTQYEMIALSYISDTR